jgi:ABC-type transport system substrate-binding protein
MLGYRVRVETTLSRSRNGVGANVQLLPNTWFACDAPESRGWFCDLQLDQLMRRASALEASDPQRAAAAWAAIDRKVVDAAGWVPLVTPREVEFISPRVRNYQYHPLWGALVDQFWLR